MELSKERWSKKLLSVRPEIKNVFYRGNIDLLLDDTPKLAIVGSRRMSDYGSRVIEKWMAPLVERGVTIVSGFMYGVDQAAHRACVDEGGKTIAVLGWGIDRKVAGDDEKLYREIVESGGLILSEWADDRRGDKWTFPSRNRIVAGLSDAVWVVEGAVKSGSMITAKLALKQRRPLLALPGQVGMSVAEGVNELIKSGKAVMTTSANDLLSALNLVPGQIKMKLEKECEDPITGILESGPRSADELMRILKMPVAELMSRLSVLNLSGVVAENNGKYSKLC